MAARYGLAVLDASSKDNASYQKNGRQRPSTNPGFASLPRTERPLSRQSGGERLASSAPCALRFRGDEPLERRVATQRIPCRVSAQLVDRHIGWDRQQVGEPLYSGI